MFPQPFKTRRYTFSDFECILFKSFFFNIMKFNHIFFVKEARKEKKQHFFF